MFTSRRRKRRSRSELEARLARLGDRAHLLRGGEGGSRRRRQTLAEASSTAEPSPDRRLGLANGRRSENSLDPQVHGLWRLVWQWN